MFKTFIDVLYSIAFGIGFTEFPRDPLADIPGVFFFFATMLLSISDWYYYVKFEKSINEDAKFRYYVIQILTVFILSQLFQHCRDESLMLWIVYLILLLAIGAIWNGLVKFQNYQCIIIRDSLMILFSICLLIFYNAIMKAFSVTKSEFRYFVIAFFLVTAGVSILLFRSDKGKGRKYPGFK